MQLANNVLGINVKRKQAAPKLYCHYNGNQMKLPCPHHCKKKLVNKNMPIVFIVCRVLVEYTSWKQLNALDSNTAISNAGLQWFTTQQFKTKPFSFGVVRHLPHCHPQAWCCYLNKQGFDTHDSKNRTLTCLSLQPRCSPKQQPQPHN